jgi:hypothetical protein
MGSNLSLLTGGQCAAATPARKKPAHGEEFMVGAKDLSFHTASVLHRHDDSAF